MTTKTAVYITLNKGSMQHQLVYIPRLSDGNAVLMGRMVSEENPRRQWRYRHIGKDETLASSASRIVGYGLDTGWVSVDRPKFAAITDKDAEDLQKLGVPRGLIRRISGAVSLPGTPLPEDFSDRRFETIIDGIPEGSTFVSWLLEQDAE